MKKNKYQFYTTDWSPNGTAPVIVYSRGMQVDARDEVIFGIDVNKLGPARYLDRHNAEPLFRVPVKLLKKSVASCPFEYKYIENCIWLGKYLRGAK